MSKTIIEEGDEGVKLIVKDRKLKKAKEHSVRPLPLRSPVHVVYGGADRFNASTPRNLGDIAIKTLEKYAPNFVEFAKAMNLVGSETLPDSVDGIERLERQIARNKSKAKSENFHAWLAWIVYQRTIAKLTNEPIEDFRIDFEDGYGFRSDEEEDSDARRTASDLAKSIRDGSRTPFIGFRIKSFAQETYARATRTLDLFLETLLSESAENFPLDLVVTLPKITISKQVRDLSDRLRRFEKKNKLNLGSIGIEVMIETPETIFDRKGNSALRKIVEAGQGRVTSAHFGAFDYTSALGISAEFQHLQHEACNFARQMMLINLAPVGIRLADSVTTRLPVPVHSSGRLNNLQKNENRQAIHTGWAEHFESISRSMAGGFYQSWDLHPNQLPVRYAAVYSFFFLSMDRQAERLYGFLTRATQATLTGNTFDDAASAEGLMNYFRRGISCGGISEKEVAAVASLGLGEIRLSFKEILKHRENK